MMPDIMKLPLGVRTTERRTLTALIATSSRRRFDCRVGRGRTARLSGQQD